MRGCGVCGKNCVPMRREEWRSARPDERCACFVESNGIYIHDVFTFTFVLGAPNQTSQSSQSFKTTFSFRLFSSIPYTKWT